MLHGLGFYQLLSSLSIRIVVASWCKWSLGELVQQRGQGSEAGIYQVLVPLLPSHMSLGKALPHWATASYLKMEGLHCALYSRILVGGQMQADLGV